MHHVSIDAIYLFLILAVNVNMILRASQQEALKGDRIAIIVLTFS